MATLPQIMSIYEDIKEHTREFPDHPLNCECMDDLVNKVSDQLGITQMVHDRNNAQAISFGGYIMSHEGKAQRRINYVMREAISKL